MSPFQILLREDFQDAVELGPRLCSELWPRRLILHFRGSWCDTEAYQTGLLITLKNKREVKMSVCQALGSNQDPLNDDYDVTAGPSFIQRSS